MLSWNSTSLPVSLVRNFQLEFLRYLRHAHRFHHRRTALPVGKACGFFLVGIHAPKLFAVSIRYRHQKMMMTSALVFVKRRFAPLGSLDCFRHVPTLRSKCRPELSQGKGPKDRKS